MDRLLVLVSSRADLRLHAELCRILSRTTKELDDFWDRLLPRAALWREGAYNGLFFLGVYVECYSALYAFRAGLELQRGGESELDENQ